MSCIDLLIPLELRGPTKGTLIKSLFIPKLLNNQAASCCVINFDFLLSSSLHILMKALFFHFISLQFLIFYFLHFFNTSNNLTTLFYK